VADVFEVVQTCKPKRNDWTVCNSYKHYLRGLSWGMWSRKVDIDHELIRVKRPIEKLKAADPDISDSAIARELGVAKSTFFDIVKKTTPLVIGLPTR
jgi:AraC-like DNA-binding protein